MNVNLMDPYIFGVLAVFVLGLIAFLYAWFFTPPGRWSGQNRPKS